MTAPVIVARDLRMSYGDFQAVRGIDIEVHQGEVFAFLGPNGAGKTTTVEILEGYRARTGGHVEVLGVDPARAGGTWRARVGVVLQGCRLEPLLTVRESLQLYAGYYLTPRSVDETMDLVGLGDQAGKRAGKLSGGQQRRLDVALALIGNPELLFLDEPTTGFDPAARRGFWEMISGLRTLGKTIFLTTHYMDEARVLADRVAILKEGRIVAEGPPAELVANRAGATLVRFELPADAAVSDLPPGLAARAHADGHRVEISTEAPVVDLAQLCGWAIEHGNELIDLEVTRPTLEDVYLELTAEPV